jgi:hypothetical protein
MPRKVEIKDFTNKEGEFGYSVILYARDEQTIIKTRFFSALEYQGHYFMKEYEIKARFLSTPDVSKEKFLGLEHDKRIAVIELYRKAKACLEEFQTNYNLIEES